ncbi:uncharacterized protein LAESUDRAFT_648695, partial [Laetiporus sulphureus 93-53]
STLVLFEHIVTFSDEVHVIWRARLTTVMVMFVLNRYLLMIRVVSNALTVSSWHTPLVSHVVSCCECIEHSQSMRTQR